MSESPDAKQVMTEELRQYYLDAMGIQLWQLRHGDLTPTDEVIHREVSAEFAPPESKPVEVIQTDTVQQTGGDWSALKSKVEQCTQCELSQSRTQTVFGVGNPQADLLIIGEAPGADEDTQGEPFVGRAGQLLNAMLAAIKLERKEVFIANILKCRPPNNRDPQPEEISACNHFLQAQIELIKPKVIYAIGRIAAQSLLDTETPVGKLRQQQHEYQGIPLIVSYHPAYLLRKPTEKRKAWQDLQLLCRIMQQCP